MIIIVIVMLIVCTVGTDCICLDLICQSTESTLDDNITTVNVMHGVSQSV